MYIPKNKIKTNLYTRGDEYQNISTGINYTGYYWKMYDGKIYTGKNPNEKPTVELIDIESNTNIIWEATSNKKIFEQYVDNYDSEVVPGQYQDMNMISTYNNITNTDISSIKLVPQQYFPIPTDEDYKIGVFTRYFVVKINEPIYLELNKEIYNKISNRDPEIVWVIYQAFKLQWTLIGGEEEVSNANLNQIKIREERLGKKGLEEFLKNDYLQFYAKDSGKVLYSNGNEGLVLPDGTAYIGKYHVMLDGTHMTGATHGKGNNIILTQIYD